ncbi:MAG: hypothetical protein HY751_08010 [Nitrospinae bacterium]|nr:hypothetical protein [Nitrospinota bacterium]
MLERVSSTQMAITERRRVALIEQAQKTGIILTDGEFWGGIERRGGKGIPRKKEKPEEKTREECQEPCDFFG